MSNPVVIRESSVSGRFEAIRRIGRTPMAETLTSYHKSAGDCLAVVRRMVEVGMIGADVAIEVHS